MPTGPELVLGLAFLLICVVPLCLLIRSKRPDPKMQFLKFLITTAAATRCHSRRQHPWHD